MSGINVLTRCAAIALVGVLACGGGDATGPGDDELTVAGQESGTARLPNARGTSVNLQQVGSGVSGQMTVNGAFVGRTLTGAVNSPNRTFTWAVARDCEIWGGVLAVDAGGQQMSGAVLIDRSGCQPAQANGSGTLSVVKQ